MISYRPFWETLNRRDISTYELIYRQGVSANTIYRMKRGMPITTKTLNDLCFILDCSVSDVIEYVRDSD
ncbi:MAG: helix-turn-helix domain-containing protein [Clostridia bacterium]|nr:helix-turn-helix domain-containing protein [Clostridia bacterium]